MHRTFRFHDVQIGARRSQPRLIPELRIVHAFLYSLPDDLLRVQRIVILLLQMSDELLRILALGTVSPSHAGQFRGYVRQLRHAWSLDALLKGTMHWPSEPAERDVCYFLAQGLRARLAKELPSARAQLSGGSVQLAHRAKALLTELAEISVEAAQMVVAGAQDGVTEDGSDARLPAWFMVEVVRDLPRLAAARDGAKV